jgi:hypothetical protein
MNTHSQKDVIKKRKKEIIYLMLRYLKKNQFINSRVVPTQIKQISSESY